MSAGAELLGAHVSTAGGVSSAPARAAMVGARVMQVFTKTPNQWRDPKISPEESDRFKAEVERLAIRGVVSHDSYLINLASPDRRLRAMSMRSFTAELQRCATLGIPYVVSHPGNYMDDRDAGIRRNADAYASCLASVPGPGVLIEGTAGTGTALGSRFEELAALRAAMPADIQSRVGFCLDTCHLYAAGQDLVNDWDGVWAAFDRLIGWDCLKCLHLNDSQTPFGSRRDRHAWIGEGSLGPEPFRRVMRDPRFAGILKIIETPKEDDPVRHDRRMLRRLKSYALKAAAAVLLLSSGATAQTRAGVGVGMTMSSALARDSIVEPVLVRPAISPGISFWVETVLNPPYRLRAGLGTTWGKLSRHQGGSGTAVVPLSTWVPSLTLERRIAGPFSASATVGAMIYRADRTRSNLFRQGSGPMALLGVGALVDHPLSGGLTLSARLAWDLHRFVTPAMRDAGFQGERPVQRVGITVGIGRGL